VSELVSTITLYAIENLFRIIVHSVLTVQIHPNWWSYVISNYKDGKVQAIKQDYANQPGSTLPGSHDIYYLFLSDLTKIISDHSHLFIVFIPDINQWIIKLEQVRLPRNIVGHMNWPSVVDRSRIDKTYRDTKSLIRRFSNSGINIIIP
jgi:hypothetical protein